MRTTLSIDDDVFHAVRERAIRERRPAGAVLSDLARQALTGSYDAATLKEASNSHGFRPLPARGPVVSRALIDHLREDELA